MVYYFFVAENSILR